MVGIEDTLNNFRKLSYPLSPDPLMSRPPTGVPDTLCTAFGDKGMDLHDALTLLQYSSVWSAIQVTKFLGTEQPLYSSKNREL